jgi:hypothetical protein
MIASLLALSGLFGGASAHPTKYPNQKELNCHEPAPILSYHTHVVYMLTDPEQTQRALELRERTIEHFKPLLGEDCDGRYDEGRFCMSKCSLLI